MKNKALVINALTSEPFAEFIKTNGIDEFYIAGADATACVKSTCYNMTKLGYKVTVLSDCITSYDNVLTGIRIICSIVLLFIPAYSVRFYLLYVVAGITDMLNGFVARKRHEYSTFGATFDSIADFIFVGTCLFKLLPLYDIPLWLYVWIAIIILIKLFNVVLGFAIRKTLVVEHTVMNKIVGTLLFVFPLAYSVISFRSGALFLCAIAGISAIQEGYYIKTGKQQTERREIASDI